MRAGSHSRSAMESQPLRVHVRIRDVVRKRSSSISKLKAKKEEEKKWIWTSRLDDEKGPLGRCPKTAFPIGNGAEREGMNASRSSTPQGPEEVNIKSKKEEDPLRDLMKAGNDQIRD
ncbi:hypothetical protein V6N13_034926 [Hibiscus sabdariffa]